MARLNSPTSRPKAQGPLSAGMAEVLAQTRTHEGAPGFTRDAKTDLFLATLNSFNEDHFYETAAARVERIRPLIASIAVADPEWLRSMISWERRVANLRTVPTILAAEAIKARLNAKIAGGNREFVTAAVGRIDEASEFVAYWHSTFGKALPKPVKRGIADALTATKGGLTEYGYLKYRGKAARGSISLADLINLTHPEGKVPWQKALFGQVLEDAYDSKAEISAMLPMVRARRDFLALSKDEQIKALTSKSADDTIKVAGLTHEVISSALGGVPAQVWERLVPRMGYQALLMNLRRIEESKPREELIDLIVKRLKDPEEVAKSKMLPMRFLSAYRHAPLDFHGALQKAMDYTVDNVPDLPGKSLILVDRSLSMNQKVSSKSTLSVMDTANIFGAALALRSAKGYSQPTLVVFGTSSQEVSIKGKSLMTLANNPANQGGTNTAAALRAHYAGHDRVIVLTDEQAMRDLGLYSSRYYGRSTNSDVFTAAGIPDSVPTYTWNLAGYDASHAPTKANRHLFGGMSDIMFSMIPMIERGLSAGWPWEDKKS